MGLNVYFFYIFFKMRSKVISDNKMFIIYIIEYFLSNVGMCLFEYIYSVFVIVFGGSRVDIV